MPKGVPDLGPEDRNKLNWSPKKNAVEKRGGLPPYINSIAVALVKKGMTRQRAIAIAVNMCKKMCATGRATNLKGSPKVSKAVQAAACSAAADWETRIKGAPGGSHGKGK